MPTLKKFLDLDGLILLLQEIEGLDKTNIKDLYWSTDNADVNPTVIFKVGDDNGSPHSTKKLTFKGETGTVPADATTRTLTITIGGVDKTINYYDTTNASGLTYTYSSDTGTPTAATTVKSALDRIINAINTLDPADEKVKQNMVLEGDLEKAFRVLLTTDAYTNTTTGEANFSPRFTYNPVTRKIYLDSKYTLSQGALSTDYNTFFSIGGEGIKIEKKDQLGSTISTGTLSSTDYSGNAATATKAYGDADTIQNTYATKAALEALINQLTGSFLIVSTLPTADGTHGGIIYLIKDQEYGDTNSNIFKEYIEVNDGTTSTPNWKFELLGTTDAGVDVITIPATGTNSVASMFAQYVINA